ncbi:MAG: lytic murein transglycosylase B [Betaproteobacteria bacterium]|nr:lytic murein transglycosylase B [Betaproteobacteria bacterium]
MPSSRARFFRATRILVAALVLSLPAASRAQTYAQRDEVRQFIGELVERDGFDRRDLEKLFGRVKFQPSVVRAMTPPDGAPVRSWQSYRAMFNNPARIEAGLQFWRTNAADLARAADQFGVPPEIVVGIIGVETIYGRNMGAYRVIDALTTLAFDYPRRAAFFRGELEQFLLLTRESVAGNPRAAGFLEKALAAKGSFAGAFGIPQFMPGSYRRYAVDFDGDGRRDLTGNSSDAIGSVANFLKEHGWERGGPIASPAQATGEDWKKMAAAGVKPSYRVAELAKFGVQPAESLAAEQLCALVALETPGQTSELWVGLQNFYSLTRYNRSSMYAIAVMELGRAAKAEWQKNGQR